MVFRLFAYSCFIRLRNGIYHHNLAATPFSFYLSLCVHVQLIRLISQLLCVLFLSNLVDVLEVMSNWLSKKIIKIGFVVTSLWYHFCFSYIFLFNSFRAWIPEVLSMWELKCDFIIFLAANTMLQFTWGLSLMPQKTVTQETAILIVFSLPIS